MTRFRALVLAACAWSAVAADDAPPATAPPARELPDAGRVWKVIESPGFDVYGDVEDRELAEVARRLQSLKAVLGRTASGLDLGTERPIPVYAFATDREFSSYSPRRTGTKQLDGYFIRGYGSTAIAIDLGEQAEYSSIYHELVHHITRRSFGEVPLWFAEGIAVIYESFESDPKSATIGRLDRYRLEWFGHHPMWPVAKLASVKPGDPEYNESDHAGTFYLQSSILVHDLLFGNPARGPQLAKYLDAVHSGVAQDKALETCFEGGAASLDDELKTYVQKGYYRYVTVSFDALHVSEPGKPRPLSRVETLDALGFLALAAASDEPEFARAHFDAALAAAPNDPRALAGLGIAAAYEKRSADAVAEIEQAVAAGVDDPSVYLVGARSLLSLERADTGGRIDLRAPASPRIVRARGWLERAIRADPFDDEALVAYGETYVACGDDGAPGIQAFERADRIERLEGSSLFNLFELYVRKHDRPKAEALFTTRIRDTVDPELAAEAADGMLRLDYQDAWDAAKAKDYARALPLFYRVRDEAHRDSLRAHAVDAIGQVEAAVAAASKKKAAVPAPKRH